MRRGCSRLLIFVMLVGSSGVRGTAQTRAATPTLVEISFDDKNRVLLNGTPRFVLGVYDSGMESGNTDAFWEHALCPRAESAR